MKSSRQSILTLFAASLIVYAFFHAPREEQNIRGMVIKCLPIVILQVFVFNTGLSPRDNYGHKILAGLVFSSIGDAFLDFPGWFIQGAISFFVAHLFYISAFGLTPLRLGTGIGIFGVFTLPLLLVFENLTKLEGISSVVLPLYAVILKTMVWRSVVKATNHSDNGPRDWGKISAGIGGIFFAISDMILGIDRFYQPLQHAQKVIMATYYAAQFFIALSVFHSRPSRKQN